MKHNYLVKKLALLGLMLIIPFLLAAQDRTITGKVVDADDRTALPGVSILKKGTSDGTVTDFNGEYSINASSDDILVFSFVGYTVTEVPVGNQSVIDVQLNTDVETLEEVLVVGYGTQSKREFTGAISKVGGSEIEDIPTPSFDAALQGRAPGLQVVSSSGVPGSAVRVRIRGQASISGNSEPLYVVDGIPIIQGDFSKRDGPASGVNNNALADINPNDIESIDILKDAAAAAIYGSRAANGVVLITTKKGKAGRTQFSAGYYHGATMPSNEIDFLNSAEWLTLYDEAYRNSFGTALPADWNIARGVTPGDVVANGTDTDWIDQVTRTGSIQEATISARGGNEKTIFYIAGAYFKEDGFLEGNSFERVSARVNIDNEATEKLRLGTQFSISATRRDQPRTGENGTFGLAQYDALPIYPVFNPDGSFFGSTPAQANSDIPNPAGINPVAQLSDQFQTDGYRVLGNLYAEYEFTPGLTLRGEFGTDFYNQFDEIIVSPVNRYIRPVDYTDPENPVNLPVIQAGSFEERRINVFNYNAKAFLTYDKYLQDVHHVKILLGSEIQRSNQRTTGNFTFGNAGFIDPFFSNSQAGLTNFDVNPNPAPPTMGGYNSDLDNNFSFVSFFTRVNYSLRDKWLFAVSLRTDGSSRFGANNRFGFFPAVSAGWVISDEDFFNLATETVNYLKLRASWGKTGNAEIGNFGWLASYGQSIGYLGQTGLAQTRFANPDLTWENNYQFDFGIDFELFSNRLNGSLGYYNKRSTDLLLNQSIQASTGFTNVLANTGIVVRNQGVELNLQSVNLNGALRWTTDFNIARNDNVVLDDGGLPPDAFDVDFGEGRVVEGFPIGITYVTRSAGVDPADGRELFFTADGTETFKATVEDPDARVPVGNPFPNFVGGINNTLTYKGFELSFLFTFSEGNTVYDDGAKFQIGDFSSNPKSQRRDILNRWQSPENPGDGKTPAIFVSGPGSGRALNSDRFLYDASFLRLRTLTLAYNLPENLLERIGLNNLRIYVTGQNLLLFTKYPGWDPEFTNDGGGTTFFTNTFSQFARSNISFAVANRTIPQTKSFIGGITIGF